ncbi:MAG: hypothetical protein EOP87_16890 [Verrucomicrobiaceae bacterium]|nr:MAG: hypothetical protein EOP87_16890 [Verrucomicrobiaceae bacterium]
MIADPLSAAKRLDKFPVYCPACGVAASIDPPGETAICGIIERSHEIEWNYERMMLRRLDALVRLFPDSCHRDKVRVTTSKAGPNNQYHQVLDARPMEAQPIITRRIEPDPEFDAALNADPELRDWMKGCSFLLYYRLKMFEDEADYSDRYQFSELKCPECGDDYLAIDRQFFETLA